jgi:hypothetical protein
MYEKKKLVEQLNRLATEEEKIKPQIEEVQTIFYFTFNGKDHTLKMPSKPSEANQEAEQCGVFYEIFGRYSATFYGMRLVIFILLLISLVLFSFVLIQHISSGWDYVWNWIKSWELVQVFSS